MYVCMYVYIYIYGMLYLYSIEKTQVYSIKNIYNDIEFWYVYYIYIYTYGVYILMDIKIIDYIIDNT